MFLALLLGRTHFYIVYFFLPVYMSLCLCDYICAFFLLQSAYCKASCSSSCTMMMRENIQGGAPNSSQAFSSQFDVLLYINK